MLPDGDRKAAITASAALSCMVAGEACGLPSRILLPREHYEEGVQFAAELFNAVKPGDPLDPDCGQGPQISAAQRDRILAMIEQAKKDGARVVAGGGKPTLERGFYVQPTIIADVDPDYAIAQDEVFGPVLAVIPYDDEDDAIHQRALSCPPMGSFSCPPTSPQIERWVSTSKGKIRADKAHEKLVALGFTGTERSTRRAVAEVKAQWRLGNTRVHRPWVSGPGLWLQYDFGDGRWRWKEAQDGARADLPCRTRAVQGARPITASGRASHLRPGECAVRVLDAAGPRLPEG